MSAPKKNELGSLSQTISTDDGRDQSQSIPDQDESVRRSCTKQLTLNLMEFPKETKQPTQCQEIINPYDGLASIVGLIIFSVKDPPNLKTFVNQCNRIDWSKDMQKTNRLGRLRLWLDQHSKQWTWWTLKDFEGLRIKQLTKGAQNVSELPKNLTDLDKLLIEALDLASQNRQWQYKVCSIKLQQALKISTNKQQKKAIKYCLKMLYVPNVPPIVDLFKQDRFLFRQQINVAEDECIEFKNYRFPIEEYSLLVSLRKTVCAFLNAKGGYLFIGIKENREHYYRSVEGMLLNENQKSQFCKFIQNQVVGSIRPTVNFKEILQQKFINVEEAPVENGPRYIIRIKIEKGDPKQLYHIEQKNQSRKTTSYYIRNHHQNVKLTLMQFQNEMLRRNNLNESEVYDN